MALKDNPGITTMPRSERDWTKFIRELSDAIATNGGGSPSGNFVTLDTTQTITGLKTFTQNPLFGTDPLWNNTNVGTQINALDQDSSPVNGDFVVTYDVSEDAPKKVALTDLPGGAGGGTDDDELLHWFFGGGM
jgi:hypothetical protein